MSIPDYQSLMLQALVDGREHLVRDVRESLAAQFGLGAVEREALLPSGKQPIFDNRLGWAKTSLAKAGLVASVRRGVYQITERGRSVVASKPARVDSAFLAQYRSFRIFNARLTMIRRKHPPTLQRARAREMPSRQPPLPHKSPWTPPTTSCEARSRRSS